METAIEKSIKKFVFDKIQERVCLDVSTSQTIKIKSKSRHGSISLSMFWLRVLRHKNNYPMPKYPYKDVYDRQGNNRLLLKVDDVTITVYMNSGLLTIEGLFVLEWFLNTFEKIMIAYDAPISDPQPMTTIYRQYTENWKKIQADQTSKKDADRERVRQLEDHAVSILEDREKIISSFRRTSADSVDAQVEEGKDEYQLEEKVYLDEAEREDEADKLVQLSKDLKEEREQTLQLMNNTELWTEETLKSELKQLRSGRVKDGSTYFYKLWLSLLNYWFSDTTRQVFIVTPKLDANRLYDISKLVLDHRIEAKLDAIYVMQKCDTGKSISDVKLEVMNKLSDPADQLFVEYKVFSSLVYPRKKFNAKFIASVKDNRAEVLVTSASFHGDHFDDTCYETVYYEVLSEPEFMSMFIAPINASIH